MLVIVSACLSACVPVDQLIYLGPNDLNAAKEDVSIFNYDMPSYRLQTNDILDIRISSMDPEVNYIFNSSSAGAIQATQATAQTGGDLFYITGHSISDDGSINIPFVGDVTIVGLSLAEAREKIDSKVKTLFTNYHLQVKMGGIRFSALGEFNKPGKHVILQNQVTVLEAIAICGDLTTVANRREIRLIRQYPTGTKIHTIDLLDQDVILSSFYFIQPNDVLYAEPLVQRSWGVGITGAQTLTAVLSTLSTSAALILSVISLAR